MTRYMGARIDHGYILAPGRWYDSRGVTDSHGTFTPELNTVWYIPVYIPTRCTIQAVAVNVTSIGTSSVARIGRYGVSSGEPGVRLNDFGTVTTATTGQRSITGLSTVLNEGWQFWGLVVTGTATPILSGTSSNLGQNVLGSDTFATTTAKQAFSEVGPTTLPNPADGTLQSAGAPMVFFQLAA